MSVADPIEPTTAAAHGRKRLRLSLAARGGILVVALFAEKFALNLTMDFRVADAARGLGTVLRLAQHFGLRFAVSFAVALAFFIFVRGNASLHRVNSDACDVPLRPAWLAVHLALLLPVAAALYNLYGNHGVHLSFLALGCTAILLMSAAVLALLAALAPWQLWRRAATAVGIRWAYAALAAAAGTGAILWSQELWGPTAQLTFQLVRDVLLPVLPTLKADAATRVLRTPDFAVEVSSICSGLEGVGLMLAFCSAWLLYFRAEYRFPRALLIIPAGVLLVFALNVVRIAALVLIGNAGYPAIAVYGFHSQAGWIGFNCVACGVAFASRGSRWLSRAAAHQATEDASNPTAAYLLPFLAVLAAGMISRATSSGFETWYALRLAAAAAALAWSRQPLSRLDWRFSWRGVAVGVAIFALWLAASRLVLTPRGMPAPLGALSPGARDLWIATRAFSGVCVVPLVEELAYRGYLLRRLVAADFEAVPFGSVGWIPLLATATAFGVLHGPLWLPGIAAGLAYGLVLIRTGRMGEPLAAHLTTNLLLAAWVLIAGQWQLW
ncbi:MAG TPA: exosortase E/protease, VPEID-CTERM system [Steroidobacteraceae bacterium]|nr:exosortase E/protease, VPEID-CTERM system [Steroidobacteraceae bacterium]